MPHRFDLAIIGGGIIGLAVAREMMRRRPGARLVLLEKERDLALHQTGHNSGVIHSGIYYRPGSVKAATCREGADAMIEFCRHQKIPHRVCGKVIVAVNSHELPYLEELHRRGIANGVPGIRMIEAGLLREIEPHCAGLRALHVPGTAVTDFSIVSHRFAREATAAGAVIRVGTAVTGISRGASEVVLATTADRVVARLIVNCAGLHSDRVAKMAGAGVDLLIVPFRGEYYTLDPARADLVNGLIYPVAPPGFPFLGVHLTRGVEGTVEAGPNACWALSREGYRWSDISIPDLIEAASFAGFRRMARRHLRYGLGEIHRSLSKSAFLKSVQRLVPGVRDEDLRPGGAGVRAQAIERSGLLVDDFRLARTDGMIHVLNVPSPAATASIAIARRISQMVEESLGPDLPSGTPRA